MTYDIYFETEDFNNIPQFNNYEFNVSKERFDFVMSHLILLNYEFMVETFYKGQIVAMSLKVLHQSKYSIFDQIKDLPIKFDND